MRGVQGEGVLAPKATGGREAGGEVCGEKRAQLGV